MNENTITVTAKELFYSAMLLGLDKLVGIEYDFPLEEDDLTSELNEVKRDLRKRKLLKESSKGEITLDFSLSVCCAMCSKPEDCFTPDALNVVIYKVEDVYMALTADGDTFTAQWFDNAENVDEYITAQTEANTNG